jgi:hypothetical protein
MWLIYSTEVSLFFRLVPEHTDVFVPRVQNFVAVEIGFLYSQQFTYSHSNFFITVESATSQVLFQRPKQIRVRRGKVRTIAL